MKNIVHVLIVGFLLTIFVHIPPVYSTESASSQDEHTAREEAEGKEIWEKLQSKKLDCTSLKDEDYEALGEYFMGQTIGNSHAAMNTMMIQMMGKEGEEQMHVVMGKRMSGCDQDAQIPQGMMDMMGMRGMGMMQDSAPFGSGQDGGRSAMMGSWGVGGMMGSNWGLGGALGFLLWVVVLVDLILVGVWLWKQIQTHNKERR